MNIIETNLDLGSMYYGNIPLLIILHHAEAESCTIEDINRWHKERGWAGCGYHYFIRKDGSVYRGRPDNAIGVHCSGYNTNSLGICYEGNYMVDDMPPVQKQAGIELNQYLIKKYGITDIKPHRALYNTSCPGDKFPFDEIKKTSFNIQNSVADYQPIQSRNWLQVGDTGDKVKDLQQKLILLGYSVGICGADGSYGKDTKNAVYKFQHDNGLIEDGLAGPQTMSCINVKAAQSNYSPVIKALQHACNLSGITDENGDKLVEDGLAGALGHTQWVINNKLWIHRGMKGDLVKWLQTTLILLGFSCGSCGVDGSFGFDTLTAVQNFQSQNGLVTDGSVGKLTLMKLLGIKN